MWSLSLDTVKTGSAGVEQEVKGQLQMTSSYRNDQLQITEPHKVFNHVHMYPHETAAPDDTLPAELVRAYV